MILLSIVGLFRTILIILGIFLLLRVIGKTMTARRAVADQKAHESNAKNNQKEKVNSAKNYGRVTISKADKSNLNKGDFTDYQEVD